MIPHFDIWLPAWDKRPMLTVRPFSDEQARLLVNLRQRYEVWMAAERTRADLPYDLRRKHISGRDYLYRIFDRGGNGQSLGPTTPEREDEFAHDKARKKALKEQIGHLRGALAESAALYRARRMPLLSTDAGPTTREWDKTQ